MGRWDKFYFLLIFACVFSFNLAAEQKESKINWPFNNATFNREKVLLNKDGSPMKSVGSEDGKIVSEFLWIKSPNFDTYEQAEADFLTFTKTLEDFLNSKEEKKKGSVRDSTSKYGFRGFVFKDKDGKILEGFNDIDITFTIFNGFVPGTIKFVYPGEVSTQYENYVDLNSKKYIWKLYLQYDVKSQQSVEVFGYSKEKKEFLDGREVILYD